MKKETYTIVKKGSSQESHYDTNDQRFYGDNWERTQDSKEYLERLIKNDSEKFEGCIIEDND
jgi:formiminotetrahydrofolate cyclodeaminase